MTVHQLEIISLVLGSAIGIMRLWPHFRSIVVIFQVVMFVTQVFNIYLKNNPEKRKDLKLFYSQMLNHYLRTHPEGKHIAETTDADEKVQHYLVKRREKKDFTKQLNEFFRI